MTRLRHYRRFSRCDFSNVDAYHFPPEIQFSSMHGKTAQLDMRPFLLPFLIQLAAIALAASTLLATESRPPQELSISELESQIAEIDASLTPLAHFTLRGGVGNLGWISKLTDTPQTEEWAKVTLDATTLIDQVILVPVIWRNSDKSFESDGFPIELTIIVGSPEKPEGQIIANFSAEDHLSPRIAPLSITFDPLEASWLRIEAKPIASQVWDGRYAVQLAEILIFSSRENVALNRSVQTSSQQRNFVKKAMGKSALVDGQMPYLMDAATGEKGEPYIAFYFSEKTFAFTIDLQNSTSVNGVNLHAADIRENVPRIHHADYGMPTKLLIEGANQSDFSDRQTITTFERETLYETGSILKLRFPEVTFRYIRLTALQGYQAPEANQVMSCFGLAEIEILSDEVNVALNHRITDEPAKLRNHQGHLKNLTDGRDHFGDILPLKEWLNQLALRHDLEHKRLVIAAELQLRYSQQKRYLKIMYWVSGILAVVILLVLLISRIIRMRQVALLKQRFAADLHDELGANLHSIGLISDLAKDADSKEEWQILSTRIRDLTERTGTAVRHCSNMLEAKNLYIGLVEDMKRSAKRITTNLEHSITIEGEVYLDKLKPRQRVDLFLFYKESLVNICRHSGATAVETHLSADPKYVTLTVHDNGTGLSAKLNRTAPKSLQRRAKLLKAHLTVASSDSDGTSISLKLRF
ncbi:MAG: sensor histidine kinase [Opitutaceae bacterium]